MWWRILSSRYAVVLGTIAVAVGAWNLYVAGHSDGVVEGRVVGPAGEPVAGATVALFERTLTAVEPRASAQTGPDGGFRFAGQKAHHIVLEARKDGAGRSPRTSVRLFFRGQHVALAEPLRLAPAR